MKTGWGRTLVLALALAMVLSIVLPGQAAATENDTRIHAVTVTFQDQTKEVLTQVMDVEHGVVADVHFKFDIDLDYGEVIQLTQRNLSYELCRGYDTEVDVPMDALLTDEPLYVAVVRYYDDVVVEKRVLNLRVNPGAVEKMFASQISSEFGSGIKIDMSEILHGMEFDLLPFVIPVTVKSFEDGRFRVGFGINSSDKKFWDDAKAGKLPEKIDNDKLLKVLNGDSEKQSDIKGDKMGLVMIFAGWVEGNLNTSEPAKGHFQAYIGTGFDIKGQYTILTWQVTLTGGGTADFDCSFEFDPSESRYSFKCDRFAIGAKGGLELFGGIGCASIAALGVYGAGSVAVTGQIYPDAGIDHLIFAGECGFKAKIFGRNLFVFKFLSGSKDVLDSALTGTARLDLDAALSDARAYLLRQNYAAMVPKDYSEIDAEPVWHGEDVETPTQSLENSDYEHPHESCAHLLASDIYSDTCVQVTPISYFSSGAGKMMITFVGNDVEHAGGNRECVMAARYNLDNGIILEPKRVTDSPYAEYNPDFYIGAHKSYGYLAFQRARDVVTPEMSYGELAGLTDIWLVQYYDTTGEWVKGSETQVTALKDKIAADPQVFYTNDEAPMVAYYTNTPNDPAGLGCAHELYVASRNADGRWTQTKLGDFTGSVSSFHADCVAQQPAICLTYEHDGQVKSVLYLNNEPAMEVGGAENAQFVRYGGPVTFAYTKEGRVWARSTVTEKINAITPEELPLNAGEWHFCGDLLESGMVWTLGSADGSQDAYALVRAGRDTDWKRMRLTDLPEKALINYFSAAYTENTDEPVIVYSVQNYEENFPAERLDAEHFLNAAAPDNADLSQPVIRIGEADDRFTDTNAELYAQALHANQRVTILSAKADDESAARPGNTIDATVTVMNNGLYRLDRVWLKLDGVSLGAFDVSLLPGETAELKISAPIPEKPKGDTLTYEVSATARDGVVDVQSARKLTVGKGYIALNVRHERHEREEIVVSGQNLGFTKKRYVFLVRDEARDLTLREQAGTLAPGDTFSQTLQGPNQLFAQDGVESLKVYLLMDDETISDSLSNNRYKTVKTLDMAYYDGSNVTSPLFRDVQAGAWYAPAVQWAAKQGIVNGTSATTFSPDNVTTRGQLMTMLWRAAGKPAPQTAKGPFQDVEEDSYCAQAVNWAYEQQIAKGTRPDVFCPDAPVTREQIACFLCRYARAETPSDAAVLDAFRDRDAVSDWALDAMAWAVREKLVQGAPGDMLRPADNATRAQAVTILARLLNET